MIYTSLCPFLPPGKQTLRQYERKIEVFVIAATKIGQNNLQRVVILKGNPVCGGEAVFRLA